MIIYFFSKLVRNSVWGYWFLEVFTQTISCLTQYILQEAMESSAFPIIIRVKLMKQKMYQLMNISVFPKIIQMLIELYVSSLETSGKHPFLFWLVLRGKCINHKKLNVKTLSRSYTKRTHQRAHSKMFHLDMPAEQTHSVEFSILC